MALLSKTTRPSMTKKRTRLADGESTAGNMSSDIIQQLFSHVKGPKIFTFGP